MSTLASAFRRHAPLGFTLLSCAIASLAAALAPFAPGAVVPTDPNAFSAQRAQRVLERLIRADEPHPVGSRENRGVRASIERELATLGLEARVQSDLTCGGYGVCARVENLRVEIEGEQRTGGIALAAHYDSVPAGPGAGDDAAGVASLLEIARALVRGPKPRRSIWLWFTDGEEMGLLGARALVADAALRRKVDLVVNLEARGTSGPSLMFESSTPNDGLVEAFARSVDRPVAGSVFNAVYRSMPNDTDLSVFRRSGLSGINLAFIGGATRYHTPGDRASSLSQRSLQHQGEQALALVRTFAREGAPKSVSDAVFFDFFGWRLFHASVDTARLITLLLLLLGFAGLVRFSASRGLKAKRMGLACVWTLSVPLLAMLSALPLHGALAWVGALDQPWPATTWTIFCSCASLAGAALLFVSRFARGFNVDLRLAGLWLLQLIVSGLLAILLPEALPWFALPALATMLAVGARMRLAAPLADLALSLPGVVNALLWAPVVALALLALGVWVPSLQAALAALLILPLFSVSFGCSRRVTSLVASGFGGLAVLFGVLGIALPGADASAPARVNLAYHADLTRHQSRRLLQAARVPEALSDLLRFESNDDDPFPWFGATQRASFRASAPWVELPAPTLSVERDRITSDGRELDLVISPGQSDALALIVGAPGDRLKRASIERTPITPVLDGDFKTLGMVSPAAAVRVSLELAGAEALSVRLVELHMGLPEGSGDLVRARDIAATASQTGDITVVSRDEQL